MTYEEFIKEFKKRIEDSYREYKNNKSYVYLPRYTGNLQDNAFNFKEKENEFVFYVDKSKADYVDYINSKKWGKGWWDKHFFNDVVEDDVINELVNMLGSKNVKINKGWR